MLLTRRALAIAAVVLVLATALTQTTSAARLRNARPETEEQHAWDEAQKRPQYDSTVEQIVAIFKALMQQAWNVSPRPTDIRQAHFKQHGCVLATVTPLGGLNSTLAQGVFANAGQQYPAFIRFSNGAGRGFSPVQSGNESDLVPDIRGFGIKLLNVSGPFVNPYADSQAFTMTTDRVTFLPDENSALEFFQANQQGSLALGAWLLKNPRLALLYGEQATVIADLLTTNFWSPVPQMHGAGAYVKHHVYPCDSAAAAAAAEPAATKAPRNPRINPNYLEQLLQEELQYNNACFRWAVQFYQDEYSTPLNDSTYQWNSPFADVAQIDIPAQSFLSAGQQSFCQWLSFNPGDTIAAHQPVGPTQLIREAVYAAMANMRHSLQSQPVRDATYEDWLQYPYM